MPDRATLKPNTLQPDDSVGFEPAPVKETPCCKKCKLLSNNTCGGCGRSLMEIAMWKTMTEAQRKAVWERIEREKP